MNKNHTNRLINEKSPYLLQHAHNPVDWYPWSEEAFQKAKVEDKIIFLSVGYATCHWCHVMEKESFEDATVAFELNSNFIAIKVDREERPDIDAAYMKITQLLTGRGGWPMSVFLTPDKLPIFAGTYFPKRSRSGMPGFIDILEKVNWAWKNDRENILESAIEIANAGKENYESATVGLNEKLIYDAYSYFRNNYDKNNGGWGGRPKFPSAFNISFLLRFSKDTNNQIASQMAFETLEKMRLGGIYDQIGFGFHRYSTDAEWLLPHFEKMLYDNAFLLIAYAEAYSIDKNELFKQTVLEIFDYIKRDMLSDKNMLFSAQDADSEGEEGKFYVWNKEEIEILLGQDAQLFCDLFQIKEQGNFIHENGYAPSGQNIPHLKSNIYSQVTDSKIGDKTELCRQKLLTHRSKRIPPLTDDKILTDWNSMMIGALALAGRQISNSEMIEFAEKIANSLFTTMFNDKNKKLSHRYRDGEVAISGFAEDYLFFSNAFLELYRSTFETKYLQQSKLLCKLAIEYFWDKTSAGFYMTDVDTDAPLGRQKELFDNALPSANAIGYNLMLRLSRLTGEMQFQNLAYQLENLFANVSEKYPHAFCSMLSAKIYEKNAGTDLVIVAKNKSEVANQLIKLNAIYNYDLEIICNFLNDEIVDLPDFIAKELQDNKPTFYLCKNFTCEMPTNDFDKIYEYII